MSLANPAKAGAATDGRAEEGRDTLDWRLIYRVLDRVSKSLDEALLANGKQSFAPTHMSMFLNEALSDLGIKLTSRARSELLGRVLKELCGPGSRIAAASTGGFQKNKPEVAPPVGKSADKKSTESAEPETEPEDAPSLAALVEEGCLSPAMARFLELAVISRLNVLILGAGGIGRKRLLGALARNIDVRERVATVEARRPIQLDQVRVHRLKAEVTGQASGGPRRSNMPELLWRALSAKPGYLLVGDFPDSLQSRRVDGLLQAPGQGQAGVLAVADEVDEAALMERLGTLLAVESQARGFDLVVHLDRRAGNIARISRISEIVTASGEEAGLIDLFVRVAVPGEAGVGFKATGASPRFAERTNQSATQQELRKALEPTERPWHTE